MRSAKRKLIGAARWGFLALFLVLCCQIAALYGETRAVTSANLQLAALHTAPPAAGEPADWSKGLLEQNPDYAGWLTVYGTQADLPVVLGEDNTWYLSHDFYGETSRHGTLFLDAQTDLSADGNLLIYGHKMKDGTMFGQLDRYKSKDLLAENGLVCWESAAGTRYYRIFAVLVVPGDPAAPDYLELTQWVNEIPDSTAEEMLDTLRSRAALWRGVGHEPGDRYLMLVTCDYTRDNGRLLLVAQRLPEDFSCEEEAQ